MAARFVGELAGRRAATATATSSAGDFVSRLARAAAAPGGAEPAA